MDRFYPGDAVTLKADRQSQGVVFEADPADGSIWVDFPFQRRPSDWFGADELILVRRA